MFVGIDLGGTKIEAVALDEQGQISFRERLPTPAGDYDGILSAIVGLVSKIEQAFNDTATVGIGTPGALSLASGLLRNSNTVCLNGQPLKTDLEARLDRKIALTNDANCFALSEAVDGAGQGAEVVFGVIIGTGTGAGIVVNQTIIAGPNRIAGEWGHNPLPWPESDELPGPDCYCGKTGCIETWLSGPGLENDYASTSGQALEARRIAEHAETADTDAVVAMTRYEDRLARGLASVINILDPDVIVLGGGMSNIDRLYENVPDIWSKYVFSDRVDTRLLKAQHGDSSGVRGAAWLGQQIS